MTLTLDPFVPDRDASLLHSWVAADRARFWMMQEHTVEEVREIYTWLDEQPTPSPPRSLCSEHRSRRMLARR